MRQGGREYEQRGIKCSCPFIFPNFNDTHAPPLFLSLILFSISSVFRTIKVYV